MNYKLTRIPFSIIAKAVNDLADFVKPTYGPSRNKVLIENERGVVVLDDGVKIAQEFGSEDRLENAVINFIKATSKKTNDRVGDGTTGSMILLQAIISKLPPLYDSAAVIKELEAGMVEAKRALLDASEKIETQEDLQATAFVSCNDEFIASLVSELVFKIGDGLIVIDTSSDLETTSEFTDGLQIDRGYVHPFMAIDQKRMQSVLLDSNVVLFNGKVGEKDLLPTFQKMINGKKNLLIIAEDYEKELVDLINKMHGTINVVAIKCPAFGNDRVEWLKDIGALCNTPVYEVGKEIDFDTLGGAARIVVGRDSTVIVNGNGKVEDRIEELKAIKTDSEYDKKKIENRVSKLAGGAGTIKVGGLTDEEMLVTADKIEDCVNSTRLAYKSGVVPGGGIFLSKIETSSPILNEALKAPLQVLKENTGAKLDDVKDSSAVLIAGIESAVSIACLLISTKGILVKYQDDKNG